MPGVAAVTGHRPNKLGGYRIPNPIFNSVMEGLDKKLLELRPDTVITGMAIGVDQWMAELCIFNGIPFIAAIPFEQQESKWPGYAQARYHEILAQAHQVVLVSSGLYEPWKMQVRNEWMVNNSNYMIAVFDGTPGGTANCLSYAIPRKPVHYCDFQRQGDLQIQPEATRIQDPRVETPEIRERRARREQERQARADRIAQQQASIAEERAERARENALQEERRQALSEGNRRAREEAARIALEEAVREAALVVEREAAAAAAPPTPVVEEEKEDSSPTVIPYGRFVDLS